MAPLHVGYTNSSKRATLFPHHAEYVLCHVLYLSYHVTVQLIIAVAGVLSGYDGSFEFKEPGQSYGDVPYVGMRVVSPNYEHGYWLGGYEQG